MNMSINDHMKGTYIYVLN